MSHEILVIPFPHPGHLFPITELCKQLAARNYKITLFSSPFYSSSSLHPSIRRVEIPLSDSIHFLPEILDETLSNLVGAYFDGRDSSDFPVCAIVDGMIISWAFVERILEFQAPVVSFFTSSASSTALSHAMDGVSIDELTRGETMPVPGLPAEMALTSASVPSIRCHRPGWPRELEASGRAVSLIFNTCEDLERPFLDYIAREAGKPVWGVGPLLPARFKDGAVRFKREGDAREDEVIAWLDSKPCGSVIYVSFGSLVNPTDEELAELAAALEESNRPFVWVAQPNATRYDPAGREIEDGGDSYFPAGMADRVGSRGLVIRGWAPQLSILSHPSTGMSVCHCGWNSAVEAISCGVPMLTWPVRGDQHHNAKLVTGHLKVGVAVKEGDAQVKKEDVMRGIERLAGDEEIRKQAAELKSIFAGGLPKSSSMAIDSFLDFLTKK